MDTNPRFVARCSNCNKYLFEVVVTLEQVVNGPICTIQKFKCKKCKTENCIAVALDGEKHETPV